MSGFVVILGIVALVVVAVLLWVAGAYNRLVALRNRFKNAFSQIDVQLKRRHDLIPNLVETAKGYMAHEKGTLEAVIQARNRGHRRQPARPRPIPATPPRWPAWPPPKVSSAACSAGSSPSPRPIPTSRPTRTCSRSRKS